MKGVLWNSVSVTVETHSKKQYCFLETNHGLRQNVGHYILMPPKSVVLTERMRSAMGSRRKLTRLEFYRTLLNHESTVISWLINSNMFIFNLSESPKCKNLKNLGLFPPFQIRPKVCNLILNDSTFQRTKSRDRNQRI